MAHNGHLFKNWCVHVDCFDLVYFDFNLVFCLEIWPLKWFRVVHSGIRPHCNHSFCAEIILLYSLYVLIHFKELVHKSHLFKTQVHCSHGMFLFYLKQPIPKSHLLGKLIRPGTEFVLWFICKNWFRRVLSLQNGALCIGIVSFWFTTKNWLKESYICESDSTGCVFLNH